LVENLLKISKEGAPEMLNDGFLLIV